MNDAIRELELIRERLDRIAERLDNLEARATDNRQSFVGRVATEGAFPTTTPRVYLTRPVVAGGVEQEGSAFDPGDEGPVVPTVVFGGRPALGNLLAVKRAGDRWVAMGGHAMGGYLPGDEDYCRGCPGLRPETIYCIGRYGVVPMAWDPVVRWWFACVDVPVATCGQEMPATSLNCGKCGGPASSGSTAVTLAAYCQNFGAASGSTLNTMIVGWNQLAYLDFPNLTFHPLQRACGEALPDCGGGGGPGAQSIALGLLESTCEPFSASFRAPPGLPDNPDSYYGPGSSEPLDPGDEFLLTDTPP